MSAPYGVSPCKGKINGLQTFLAHRTEGALKVSVSSSNDHQSQSELQLKSGLASGTSTHLTFSGLGPLCAWWCLSSTFNRTHYCCIFLHQRNCTRMLPGFTRDSIQHVRKAGFCLKGSAHPEIYVALKHITSDRW